MDAGSDQFVLRIRNLYGHRIGLQSHIESAVGLESEYDAAADADVEGGFAQFVFQNLAVNPHVGTYENRVESQPQLGAKDGMARVIELIRFFDGLG